MIPNHLADFNTVLGINNVDHPDRLVVEGGAYVRKCSNFDLDNKGRPKRRQGYAKVHTGAARNVFNAGTFCLFRDGSTLKMFKKNGQSYSVNTVVALSSASDLSYVKVNDAVYFTNGTDIGKVIGGVHYTLSNPRDDEFTEIMPPGQIIDFFNGRLYVARGNYVYISRRFSADVYDTRSNILAMPQSITMLRGLENGMYLSAGPTYWLAGLQPQGFEPKSVSDYSAVKGSDCVINGSVISQEIVGKALLWRSSKGLHLGDGNGMVRDFTEAKYSIAEGIVGAATVRDKDGIVQYLTTAWK